MFNPHSGTASRVPVWCTVRYEGPGTTPGVFAYVFNALSCVFMEPGGVFNPLVTAPV